MMIVGWALFTLSDCWTKEYEGLVEEEEDPTEGIDSILTQMEREILQTGGQDEDEQQAVMNVTPRIGGLTIEEFVHFLALLERVKEQHQQQTDPLDERISPQYDNVAGQQQQQHQLVSVAVATSPRISPPSDDSASSSSSSSGSSPSISPGGSSSACSGDFDLPNDGGGGFTQLERLFLRRYLHVIPEEALGGGSDCGGSRLSRALSGISSALSFLADGEDDQTSCFDSGDDERESVTPDASSFLPTVVNDPPEEEPLIPTTLDEDIRPNSYIEDAPTPAPTKPSESEEFLTVTAMPAVVIETSDLDSSSGADEVAPRPRVLEEFEMTRAQSVILMEESLLPEGVLMIHDEQSAPVVQQAKEDPPSSLSYLNVPEELPDEPDGLEPSAADESAMEEDDASGSTSVVTLIDDKIVRVDYQPPATSNAQLQLLAESQQPAPDTNSSLIDAARQDERPSSSSSSEEEEAGPVQVSKLRKFWERRCYGSDGSVKPTENGLIRPLPCWPPPPRPPQLPDAYEPYRTATSASETETGYSTDGSESVLLLRRRPPRPTPPLDYRPEPPARRSLIMPCPSAGPPEEDEELKARLLADWLSSHGPGGRPDDGESAL